MAAVYRDRAATNRLQGHTFWSSWDEQQAAQYEAAAIKEEQDRLVRAHSDAYERALEAHAEAQAHAQAEAEEAEARAEQEWHDEQERERARAEERAKALDWVEGEIESIALHMGWEPPDDQALGHYTALWSRARDLNATVQHHALAEERSLSTLPRLLSDLSKHLTKELGRNPEDIHSATVQLDTALERVVTLFGAMIDGHDEPTESTGAWAVIHDYNEGRRKVTEACEAFETIRDVLTGELREYFRKPGDALAFQEWYIDHVRELDGVPSLEPGEEEGPLGGPLVAHIVTTAFNDEEKMTTLATGLAKFDRVYGQRLRELREHVLTLDALAANRRKLDKALKKLPVQFDGLNLRSPEKPSQYDELAGKAARWRNLFVVAGGVTLCLRYFEGSLHWLIGCLGMTLCALGMTLRAVRAHQLEYSARNEKAVRDVADAVRPSLNEALTALGREEENLAIARPAANGTPKLGILGGSIYGLVALGVVLVGLAIFAHPPQNPGPDDSVTRPAALQNQHSAPPAPDSGARDLSSRPVPVLERQAQQGNVAAATELGIRYLNGKGVKRNNVSALKYLLVGIQARDPRALTNVGWMYTLGQAVPRDDQKALVLFNTAAKLGYPNAEDSLGFMYEHGRGVPVDLDAAASWYRKAADQGFAKAKNNLQRLSQQ